MSSTTTPALAPDDAVIGRRQEAALHDLDDRIQLRGRGLVVVQVLEIVFDLSSLAKPTKLDVDEATELQQELKRRRKERLPVGGIAVKSAGADEEVLGVGRLHDDEPSGSENPIALVQQLDHVTRGNMFEEVESGDRAERVGLQTLQILEGIAFYDLEPACLALLDQDPVRLNTPPGETLAPEDLQPLSPAGTEIDDGQL